MKRVCAVLLGICLAAPVLADNVAGRFSDLSPDEQIASPAVDLVPFNGGPMETSALRWFNNEDEFRRAAGEAGKEVKCTEDFEGSNLPPNSVLGFADPLQGGVPNDPYPNGLACRNLTVQSNTLGGAPTQPQPRGANGLAAASAGFLGATSDIVLANTFVDSLDHIYSDECCKTAVGGNTLNHVANNVTIRVYSTGNVLLGQMDFPANIQGTNFFGVISDSDCIGRINIFQAANGAEGLDNVSLWCRGDGGTTCKYNRKVKAKGGCQSCPTNAGCEIDTEIACDDEGQCQKKIKDKIGCPNGPGKCKIKMKRCACD